MFKSAYMHVDVYTFKMYKLLYCIMYNVILFMYSFVWYLRAESLSPPKDKASARDAHLAHPIVADLEVHAGRKTPHISQMTQMTYEDKIIIVLANNCTIKLCVPNWQTYKPTISR